MAGGSVKPIRPARSASPRYELRLFRHGPGDSEMRVYRLPVATSEDGE